ncbi:MAG: hypothetical protein WDM91_00255 [Rhizomicrobium sp.]
MPESKTDELETPADKLKRWITPVVIASQVRRSKAHVTQYTDGTDTGGNHSQYGS